MIGLYIHVLEQLGVLRVSRFSTKLRKEVVWTRNLRSLGLGNLSTRVPLLICVTVAEVSSLFLGGICAPLIQAVPRIVICRAV